MGRSRGLWSVAFGLLVAVVVAGVSAASPLGGIGGGVRLVEAPRGDAVGAYMLRLAARPAIEVETEALESGLPEPLAEGRGRARHAGNERMQERVVARAEAEGLIEDELYRVGTAYNGVAVIAHANHVERLAELPGVEEVVKIPLHERHNSLSVPYVGGPSAWATDRPGAPGEKLTGAGMRIGIIDSGVDYVHTNFGGPGTEEALEAARSPANNPEINPNAPLPPGFEVEHEGLTLYPSAKVVGGIDFAGDEYEGGGSTARADPNPMDCPTGEGGGHGSHVAGSAAGYGVNPDGTTFTGDYASVDADTDFRIGPGVAPEAEIYAIRVFGCTGTTALATKAIDWALDPNGDGDSSDRLDVINLSLGSTFQVAEDPTLVAAQNAVEAGVIVVGSAGNSGNQTFQLGGAGAAPGAISVANTVAATRTDRLLLQAPRPAQPASFSALYPWSSMSEPVGGPLVRLTGSNASGCNTYSMGQAAAVAGKVVMVDWRPASGDPYPCGSAVRADNAAAAGAVGIVMADVEPFYESVIGGNETIPAAYVIGPVRQYLIEELSQGPFTVTFSADELNADATMQFADTVARSSSRGPRAGGALKPDLSAPGTTIHSTDAGTGSGGTNMSGTSMAAPHVAGAMALLRQARPDWSVEDLKALAMNTADPEIYAEPGHAGEREAPQRVGAGRVDLESASASETVALAASEQGEVSVSFGPLVIPVDAGPFAAEREIVVRNHGAEPITYTVGFDEIAAPPGVEWSLPDGDEVTVPAEGEATLRLQLLVPDPRALRHRREASMPPEQEFPGVNGGSESYRRWWLAEASGAVTLEAAGEPTLRVPAYASLRPAGSLRPVGDIQVAAEGTSTGTLALTGANADTGGNGLEDYSSITAGFELQAHSPRLPELTGLAAAADIRHVGVAVDSGAIYFAVGSRGQNPAPGSFAVFTIRIDSDRDGDDDYVIYNARMRDDLGAYRDYFTTYIYDVEKNKTFYYAAPVIDLGWGGHGYWGPFDSEVIAIPVRPQDIGLGGGATRFNYRVLSQLPWVPGVRDSAPEPVGGQPRYLTWDYARPGIAFDPMLDWGDVGGLQYEFDAGAFAANGSLGALLFQTLNSPGEQSQEVAIEQVETEDPSDGGESDPGEEPSDPLTPGEQVGPPPSGAPSGPGAGGSVRICRVPRLGGLRLLAAWRVLRRANCRLGPVHRAAPSRVRGRRTVGFRYVVRRQGIPPRSVRPAGTRVSVRLVAVRKRPARR